jgi:aspartate kinase
MKVYKFGGASVRDAAGIRNLAEIAGKAGGNLVIVVSAFGKTTNALEKVLQQWLAGNREYIETLNNIYSYHLSAINDLFKEKNYIHDDIQKSFKHLKTYLSSDIRNEFDFEYDQVVSFGEIWSTMIVAAYLKARLPGVEWKDIRKCLLTDDRYRDANIIWDESMIRVRSAFSFSGADIYVTQGFIGATQDNFSTTLGREGSDYTAALIGNMLDAESVTVWKDVPGIMNADPVWMKPTIKLNEISYREAVEMTFSGAKVIHPKTIKPLHNKNIPMYVKSFIDPSGEGTVIKADPEIRKQIPVFVRKESQILISILPLDFSFVMGDNLSRIFNYFTQRGIKVNLVEASAVSIDVCVNDEKEKVKAFIEDLKPEFSIIYNENVEMLSVRHYDEDAIQRIITGREVLLQQRTRSTVRFVVRK